ncbi:MAG TPA: hypothetical protein VN428_02395 [Bryobacteraceae bacterium]|nr:hypothetical protein [Bryobacteraceae bacterium]
MALNEYQSYAVTKPAGPRTRLEPTDVPPDAALLSINAEYQPGSFGTRRGFGTVWNPNEPISSLYNWISGGNLVSAAGNSLIYYNATSGKVRMVPNLSAPVPVDLFTQAGAAGASIASGGTRLYVATYTSAGAGAGACRIVGIYGAAVNTDTAFLGPITTKPTLSSIGTGNVTKGLHRVGYVIETRNGFIGKLCPATAAGEFDQTSEITVAAGKTIRAIINPAAWPAEASKIHLFMSPVVNPYEYYLVEGATASVPGGAPLSITLDIDVDDTSLMAGTPITGNADLLTATVAGVAPFNPFAVLEYGNRIVYLTNIDGVSQAYASEPEKPQHITADQHVLTLPGFRQMTAGFALRGGLYLLGPHWTYATEDNGAPPVEWPTPHQVDGTIGAMGPRCVTANPSQGFAVVAHVTGLYVFTGGAYATRPLSYYVEPEWKRINWNAAATVQVADDKDKQQIYVLVPLDGATSPTHIFMFDYADGLTPEKVAFSLWSLDGYNPGAMCVVQNPSTKQLELWLGNSVAGKVLRQMTSTADLAPYNDDGAAIGFQYQTALLPGMAHDIGAVYGHYAVQFRAMGSGALSITAKGIDNVRVSNTVTIALAAAPGQEYTKRYHRNDANEGPLISESASYTFSTNASDEHATVSGYQHLFKPWVSNR